MRSKAPCSDEVFVVSWEKASTLTEAARVAGYVGRYATKIASRRAARLRTRGVVLRRFVTSSADGRQSTVQKLNWMAERARSEA